MSKRNDFILEVEKLKKTFSNNKFCLDNVSFSVPYGSIMGFVGENGAGKTTTIGCILGTLNKDSGRICLFGKELTGNDIEVEIKEQIGVVYDASNFAGNLTPNQISEIMKDIYKNWNIRIYKEYLQKFNLPEQHKISTFSKGMTMKLSLAVAISHEPKLLILDEATSGLDPVARDEILDVFLEFIENESRSIFISSHITSDLEKIADYITFIHKGKVLLSESKDKILYNYGIIRCKHNQFNKFDNEDIIAFNKKDYQTDILISDKNFIKQKYIDAIVDNATIDEILLLLVKGMN